MAHKSLHCSEPYNTLYIEHTNQGRMAPCCAFYPTVPIKDYAHTLQQVKVQLQRGEWPDNCVSCQQHEQKNLTSRRLTSGKQRLHDQIQNVEINLSNLCNLKCAMCSPTDSNQWYDDYNAVWGYDHFWDSGEKIQLEKNKKNKFQPVKNIFEWSDDPNLWKQIENHIDQFRRIYIVGGEPLIIDAHYDFLQKCVDGGYAKNLVIEYNSNITNIPQRAWNIWKHFKNVVVGVSIDGIGEVNNLIRFPSKWWKIEENLLKSDLLEQACVVGLTTPQPIALVNLSENGLNKDSKQVSVELKVHIEKVNQNLANYERISTIVVTKEIWSEQNKLLTPTLKVKRNKIDEKYMNKYLDWHRETENIIMES